MLNEAIATASATCVGNVVETTAESKAISTILGFCGMPRVMDPITWSESMTGSETDPGFWGGVATGDSTGTVSSQGPGASRGNSNDVQPFGPVFVANGGSGDLGGQSSGMFIVGA